MKTKLWAVLISLFAMLSIVGLAEAGNGTLTFTLKYKDSAGTVTAVPSAFVYLHNAAKAPPMEKFYSKADQILSGSFGNGDYMVTVPEGTYFIRINQRAEPNKQTSSWSYGPPQTGDLTWMQTTPITIAAGQILRLGTLYMNPFDPTPIIISGTIKKTTGVPAAGYYVRAQTEPCTTDGYNFDVNQCGPVKFLSMPTDVNGNYSLVLRDSGTYYLYATNCFSDQPGCSGYCDPGCIGTAYPGYGGGTMQPVTVQSGDRTTANITVY